MHEISSLFTSFESGSVRAECTLALNLFIVTLKLIGFLAVRASTTWAVPVAAAEAAKALVTIVKPGSWASVLTGPVTRASLRAILGALAHAIRAVAVGARERAQTGVVLRQAVLHLASHADVAGRWRCGRAAVTAARRATDALLLDELACVARVQIEVVGVCAVLHGP